ncbi:MAG: WXG100 family type VII secretion target [Sciscionella sp.]
MSDVPHWDEVKKLVDNPAVPDDQKQELLKSYYSKVVNEDLTGTHNDEVEQYLDKYGVSYGDGLWDTFSRDMNPFADSVDDKYDAAHKAAKKSADQNAEANKGHNENVTRGKGTLEDAKNKEADGGVGVNNSNTLLDAGAPGLRFFRNFLPPYGKLPGTVKTNPPKGAPTDVKGTEDKYNEHRDISFKDFVTDADEMISAANTERDQHQEMANSLSGLYQHWTGPAAQASQNSFTDFDKGVATVTAGLEDTGNITNAAMHTISAAVRRKAQWLLDNDVHSDLYDGKSPAQIEVIIKCANGSASDEERKQVAGYVGVNVDDGSCDKETYKQKVPAESIKWLNTFATAVESKVEQFHNVCTSAKTTVDGAFKQITDQMGKIEGNAFAKQQHTGGHGKHNGTGDAGKHNGKHNGTGDDGKHNGTGGKHQDAGNQETGNDDSGDTTDSAGPDDAVKAAGVNTSGAPSLSDSGGGTTSPAGLDGNADGTAGIPADGEPEKVTVKHGNQTITMSHPDSSGTMTLTVDDGHGQAKTFEVDFGDADTARRLAGDFGPQGISADGDVQHVEPGKDGKAVFHDGDATFTVERAADGSATVSVDDGRGQSTEYTLDPEDGGTPAGRFGALSSAGHTADTPIGALRGDLFGGSGGESGSGGSDLTGIGASGSGGGASGGGGVPAGISADGGVGAGPAPSPGGQLGATTMGGSGTADEGLATGEPAAAGAAGGTAAGAGAAGGMPMMGGMGAGRQGGDSERGASQWRTEGQLLDDGEPWGAVRNIRGVLGED